MSSVFFLPDRLEKTPDIIPPIMQPISSPDKPFDKVLQQKSYFGGLSSFFFCYFVQKSFNNTFYDSQIS